MGDGVENVYTAYTAAKAWVERALKADDSLFTPGREIWSSRWLGELRERLLDNTNVEGSGFWEKLERQMEGSPPQVYQLMGETLYVHYLIIWHSAMKGETKESNINKVIGWSGQAVTIPDDLVSVLTPGIAKPGMYFTITRHLQIGFIIEFAEQWKEQGTGEQNLMLSDPWEFRAFAEGVEFRSALLRDKSPSTTNAQRYATLNLVFPDTFEAIISNDHRSKITEAFQRYVTQPTDDVDRQLQQIRSALEAVYGSRINFYDNPEIRSQWDPSYT